MIGGYIQINDDWRIAVEDMLNFVLEKKYTTKGGKVRWEAEGYYQELEVLCLELLEYLVRESDINSVQGIIDAIRKSTSEIKTALGESPLLDGVN